MKQCFTIIVLWLVVLTIAILRIGDRPSDIQEVTIVHEKYDNFFEEKEANVVTMLTVCEYFGIKHPHIVTAQAILESGNFKSKVFKEYNNPFGLYNSKKKDYFKFKHWTDAVLAYQTMIEYKYKGGDYYQFLDAMGYAEDPDYIRKVKAIESNLPP